MSLEQLNTNSLNLNINGLSTMDNPNAINIKSSNEDGLYFEIIKNKGDQKNIIELMFMKNLNSEKAIKQAFNKLGFEPTKENMRKVNDAIKHNNLNNLASSKVLTSFLSAFNRMTSL
jgi:hypothetical protein